MVLFGVGAIAITIPGPQLSAILADVVHPDVPGRAAAARLWSAQSAPPPADLRIPLRLDRAAKRLAPAGTVEGNRRNSSCWCQDLRHQGGVGIQRDGCEQLQQFILGAGISALWDCAIAAAQ